MTTLSLQGLKQESFNALHGGSEKTYNGDAIAGLVANDPTLTAVTFNGRLFEWLGNQGQTEATLEGRKNGFAIAKGATSWNTLGAFTIP